MNRAAQHRILVVDDTAHNVKLLVDLLTAKGYEITSAASGEQALESIAKQPPDLVLLDVMMPGLDGYEVCRRIRENAATALLPVVMCTSLDPHQERAETATVQSRGEAFRMHGRIRGKL